MVDVGKVQGPSGHPENLGKKEKASADADKFKQEMRKRVTEVSKTDPDEQKKRKRREEAEEEEELQGPPQGPATPASQVTPFSLEQEKKKISPSEMQKTGPGISPTESAQPTQPPPTTAFFQAPSPAEMEDDSGMLEEEAFEETVPTPAAEALPPSMGQPQPSPPSTPPPEEEAPAFQPPPVQPPQVAEEQQAKLAPGPPRRAAPKQASTSEQRAGLTAADLEGVKPSKVQDTSAFFEKMGKEGEKGKKGAKTPEELAEEEAQVQGAPGISTPPPFAEVLEGKEAKKAEGKKEAGAFETAGILSQEMLGAQIPSLTPPEAMPPYANLHPEVMELFDRMVGVMTVMTMSGISETTFTLNTPQFASSVFFGTQIIIQEFSTAPKAFNIQLNGNPQAVALFQGNADDLMAAFQAGTYNFRVNRLETGYLTERPLFKRKEKARGKDKEQTGENPR